MIPVISKAHTEFSCLNYDDLERGLFFLRCNVDRLHSFNKFPCRYLVYRLLKSLQIEDQVEEPSFWIK